MPVIDDLIGELRSSNRIFILTGAGVSAGSGLPVYRNQQRQWCHSEPMQHDLFVNSVSARKLYWARGMIGYPLFRQSNPNPAHYAIVEMEQSNRLSVLLTQNVDGLHNDAGSINVIDLHGRLDQVVCMRCQSVTNRNSLQDRLVNMNPDFAAEAVSIRPDGDAEIAGVEIDDFVVPECQTCGGILKPNVVFFGGKTDNQTVETAMNALSLSDCFLVCGSSLSVYSGFRFLKRASEIGLPCFAINQGEIRGSQMFSIQVEAPCENVLPEVVKLLKNEI